MDHNDMRINGYEMVITLDGGTIFMCSRANPRRFIKVAVWRYHREMIDPIGEFGAGLAENDMINLRKLVDENHDWFDVIKLHNK